MPKLGLGVTDHKPEQVEPTEWLKQNLSHNYRQCNKIERIFPPDKEERLELDCRAKGRYFILHLKARSTILHLEEVEVYEGRVLFTLLWNLPDILCICQK